MARTQYPAEFKLRVVREAEEVGNTAEVARRYELHPTMVYRWLREYRRDGENAFTRNGRRKQRHSVSVKRSTPSRGMLRSVRVMGCVGCLR